MGRVASRSKLKHHQVVATQTGTKNEGNITPCAAVPLENAESGNCNHESVPNTAPVTQNDTPHATDLRRMPRLARKTTLLRCPTPAARCGSICTLSPLDAALTMRCAQPATRQVSSAGLPRKNEHGHLQSVAPAMKN